MTEEEKEQAASFIKLQDNVKELILKTVHDEIVHNFYGAFAYDVRRTMLNSAEFGKEVVRIIQEKLNKQ